MKVRVVAYVVCLTVILGLLAAAACADTVRCKPLVRRGVVVGFCFIVCNRDWEDICNPNGCIWDLHLKIRKSETCKFVKIVSMPAGWMGAISADGRAFDAKTPNNAGVVNPIPPSRCYRFCLRVNVKDCLSQERCMRVFWVTTGRAATGATGAKRDWGTTKCCLPLKT